MAGFFVILLLEVSFQTLGGFLRVLQTAKGRQAEIALSLLAEAGAGGADDVQFI